MATLQSHLDQAYAGRRTTDRNGQWTVCVDDHNAKDVSPDFCDIYIRGKGQPDDFQLVLVNPPVNDAILDLCAAHDGTYRTAGRPSLSIPLTVHDATFLRHLAKAIKGLVRRGQRYTNKNWRWVCPRTAASLERFTQHLASFVKQQRPARNA